MAKIKICGLKRPEDIRMINELKPDYCGFIIDFPKSHRSRTPDEVRELVANLDRENVIPVGVFVDSPIETVCSLLSNGTIEIAQLHGNESEEYIKELKEKSGKPVIKAFTVKSTEVLQKAADSSADYILLDQGKGSGKTFDWTLLGSPESKEIFGGDGTPARDWFLAGGLDADNISEAIIKFSPFALDLSSAVETDGFKDYEKVKLIIDTVRRQK